MDGLCSTFTDIFFLSFSLSFPLDNTPTTNKNRRVTDETDDIRHAGFEIYPPRNHGFREEHRRDAGERPRDLLLRKPAIKNEDVTWSQEEYADLGLIFEYCRYKSIQRLTEAWSTFEKAKKKRLFEFVDRKIQQMDERRQKPRETNEYDADAAV